MNSFQVLNALLKEERDCCFAFSWISSNPRNTPGLNTKFHTTTATSPSSPTICSNISLAQYKIQMNKRQAENQLDPAPHCHLSNQPPSQPRTALEQLLLDSNTDGQQSITYSSPRTFGSHPLGIEPEGNAYFSEHAHIRQDGLGRLAYFEDTWLVENFFTMLDEQTLLTLATCSKALYGLIMGFDVEIWKERVVELTKGDFIYQWNWNRTFQVEYQLRHDVPATSATIPVEYINMYNKYPDKESLGHFVHKQRELYKRSPPPLPSLSTRPSLQNPIALSENPQAELNRYEEKYDDLVQLAPQQPQIHPEPYRFATTYPPQLLHIYPTRQSTFPKIKCTGLFSDAIFQPWLTIKQFHDKKDTWVRERNIERVDINSLSVEEFNEKYSTPGKPVVLTNVMNDWPAVKDREWTIDSLLGENYSKIGMTYTCGIADLTLDKYLLYASRCDDDDTPIYLFDKQFGEKNPHVPKQYTYPPHFNEDYFGFLREHQRPSYRWWLVGPERSGSSFHIDPLLTQASNNLFIGRKLWILYPPHIIPPGIIASHDSLQVTAPFNVTEWFLNFYKQTILNPSLILNKPDPNPSQCADEEMIEYDHVIDYPKKCQHHSHFEPVQIIQKPGETVFIPATWWHSVINLEFGIAVTQNQVNQGNFIACEKFLKKIQQPSLRQDLLDSVESRYPGLHERLEAVQRNRFEVLQKYHQKLQEMSDKGKSDDVRKSDDVGKPTHKVHVEVKKELINIFNSSRSNSDSAPSTSFSFDFDLEIAERQ